MKSPALLVLLTLPAFASVPPSTGDRIPCAAVERAFPRAVCGSDAYAVVNSAWLTEFQQRFERELFRLGVVKYRETFDCNAFAGAYVALAGAAYYVHAWREAKPAEALALGVFWYRTGKGHGTHAIVAAITERGPVFIEPQTGELVTLNPEQILNPVLNVF